MQSLCLPIFNHATWWHTLVWKNAIFQKTDFLMIMDNVKDCVGRLKLTPINRNRFWAHCKMYVDLNNLNESNCLTCIQCPGGDCHSIAKWNRWDWIQHNSINIIGSNQTEILLSPSDTFVFFYALSIYANNDTIIWWSF